VLIIPSSWGSQRAITYKPSTTAERLLLAGQPLALAAGKHHGAPSLMIHCSVYVTRAVPTFMRCVHSRCRCRRQGLVPSFQQATARSTWFLGSNIKSKWKNWRWKKGDGDVALGGQLPRGELQPRLLLRPPHTSFSLLGSGELEGEGAPWRWRNLLFSAREWGVGGRRGAGEVEEGIPPYCCTLSGRNGKVRHSGDREKCPHPVALHRREERRCPGCNHGRRMEDSVLLV
jgi:hypothetical protein